MSRTPVRTFKGKRFRCANPECRCVNVRDASQSWRPWKCRGCGLDMIIVVIVNLTQVVGVSPDQLRYIEEHSDGMSPGDVLEYLGVVETV